jgi:hypothetical protein
MPISERDYMRAPPERSWDEAELEDYRLKEDAGGFRFEYSPRVSTGGVGWFDVFLWLAILVIVDLIYG